MGEELYYIPENESDFIEIMHPRIDQGKFIPAEYAL
jgi:hypothetical protein